MAEKINIEHRTSNVQRRIMYPVIFKKNAGQTWFAKLAAQAKSVPFEILRFAWFKMEKA